MDTHTPLEKQANRSEFQPAVQQMAQPVDTRFTYDLLRLIELSRCDSDVALPLELQQAPYRWERMLRTSTAEGNRQTSAAVFRRDDTVFVAFRGSHMAKNEHRLRNYDLRLDPLGDGFAHRGFLQTLSWPMDAEYDADQRPLGVVLHETLRDIRKRHPECTKLVITGHSAGAALAQIFAVDYLDHPIAGLEMEKLYTFAAPRALTSALADRLNQYFEKRGEGHCLRIIHTADNVAQRPPRNTYFWAGETKHYRHVGKPILLVPNLSEVSPDALAKRLASYGAHAQALDATLANPDPRIPPHQLDHYMDVFATLAEKSEGVGAYWRESVVGDHRRLLTMREKEEARVAARERGEPSDPYLR